ncbi:protein PAT1 homolog 2-like, partial [Saccostrea cucullata]|uniref:protein PAT1 homolog 2-like n=1 Tax=Saccostrea cuccullata TaxID=36930 RepID=UPI002ED5D8BB
MGRLARKKQHKGDKPIKEKYRTKRKTKDLDEIHEDMKPGKSRKLLNQDVDFDKPGYQHSIIFCYIGSRMPSAPIGIPRQLLRGPPPQSPYNSPGPRQSPHSGHFGPHSGSPYGPPHAGSYPPPHNSPVGPRPPHPLGHSDPRRGRGRGFFRGHNRGNYSNTDHREGYSEGHDPARYDQGHHPDNREHRRDYHDNRREHDRRRYYHYNPEEDRKRSVDAYAGLMTQKEKDWIIKIQLIQLQTENPYLDDFYYTTYSLKKKAEERLKRQQNGVMDDKDQELNLIIPAMAKLETKPYRPGTLKHSPDALDLNWILQFILRELVIQNLA